MNLVEYVHQQAIQRGMVLDEAQLRAADKLQRLYDALRDSEEKQFHFIHRLLGKKQRRIRGLYLWGGVGRGKSFLMDAFFTCAPLTLKIRVHFHRFMQDVHAELDTIKHHADPLVIVAQRIAKQAHLICFDEFHVSDIADAMLLGRLLRELLQQGVVLVATSNHKPDELYMHGLQRSHFLPAIALIKEQLDVVEIDAGIDYRLRMQKDAKTYHFPHDEAATTSLANTFANISGGRGVNHAVLEIEGRNISTIRAAPGLAWFDFYALCSSPRGQADYIEIARRFHTVLISGIPGLMSEHSAEARRFAWLVDVLYDNSVKLIVSAHAPLQDLFQEGPNANEFDRTVSRLAEMQTCQFMEQADLH